MESYIIFNNRSSLDFDIVIDEEWLPPVAIAEDELDLITVPGRDGVLTINKGRKEPIYKLISGILLNENRKMEVLKWLKGNGELILSNDPGVFYKSKIVGQIDYKYHWNSGWMFEINMLCEPYAYLSSGGDPVEIIAKNTKVNNPADKSKPLIKIYGNGPVDLIINSNIHKFNIDGHVVIDSELMECYKGSELRTFTGLFPELLPGNNNISWNGTVTGLEVIPRWRR